MKKSTLQADFTFNFYCFNIVLLVFVNIEVVI